MVAVGCCVLLLCVSAWWNQNLALWICIGETWGVFTLGDTRK